MPVRTQPELPHLILGTMNFGGRTSPKLAAALLDCAIERGLRHLDTANAYADGASERLVGDAVRRHPNAALTIATKVGIGDLNGPAEGLSPTVLTAALEASLRRLGLEAVSLLYLHQPDAATPIAATLEAVAAARAQGRIGAWALSNYGAWRSLETMHAARGVGLEPPAANQLLYNVLVRDLEREYFAFARAYALPTVAYNPLAGGLLAGHHTLGAPPPGSRFANSRQYRGRYWSARLFAMTEDLRRLAAEAGLSLLELSYRFLAGAPDVDAVIVGPATMEHLDTALDALSRGALPDDVVAALEVLALEHRGTDARYAR